MATTPTLSRRSRSTTPSGVIRAGRRLYRPASPPRTPAGTAHPARQATAATLAAAGIDDRPEALLADSGYRSIANLTEIEGTPELLIPPARHAPQGRQAVGIPERRPPRRHEGQAGQRRQDPLRQAAGDRGADVRPDQGAAGRPPVPAPRQARLPGGVEAAVRHPQPAQGSGGTRP